MKKIALIMTLFYVHIFANVNVVTTYHYLGEIVKKIGKENVNVRVLASSHFDPHFIIPKPSLIPMLSRADLLVANGAGLEIGWLPPLIRNANNSKIAIGSEGFVDASNAVHLIDKPVSVSRANGDIHPEGNPHFATDPHAILPIAELITKKLIQTDPSHQTSYQDNLKAFRAEWMPFLKKFDSRMQRCKGKKVVTYHELYNYLLKRYGIKEVATIEPLPGIAPSSKHTLEVINRMKSLKVSTILQDVYHEKKSAAFIASKTGAKVIVLPHDVDAVENSDTLERFYDVLMDRLCN